MSREVTERLSLGLVTDWEYPIMFLLAIKSVLESGDAADGVSVGGQCGYW